MGMSILINYLIYYLIYFHFPIEVFNVSIIFRFLNFKTLFFFYNFEGKGNLFTARFTDCHFDESVFPPLGGDKPINNKWREITWNTPS